MSKFLIRFTNRNPLTNEVMSITEKVLKDKARAEREIALWKGCKAMVTTELIEVPDDYVAKK